MIDIIKNKNKCTGCAACCNICPNHCIEMKPDEEGFLYPNINYDSCINCNLCESICHIGKELSCIHNKPEAYAMYTKDENNLNNSSSGGVFKHIASYVIKNGGIVYGAAFTDAYTVKHIGVDCMENIQLLQGSKYLQSDIGNVYSLVCQDLKKGRIVLFSGTPCQLAGLEKYLKKDYDNLLTLDVVCHGVPSPMVWKKYITYMEMLESSKLEKVNFRDKSFGWQNFNVVLNFDNGVEYKRPFTEDLFMKGFLADIYLRPSCYNCDYKSVYRDSDFTLADFWGVQHVCPSMENKNGTSLCWLNSEKAKKIWENIKDEIVFKLVDIDDAIKYNSAAIRSSHMPKNRQKFFKLLARRDINKAIKSSLPKQHFYNKVIYKLRRIIIN
jgi:coenzyme F420-reducing hydrogenase beta subunit